MEKGFIGKEKMELLDGLKMKSMNLLLSIIEGSVDIDIITRITQSFDDFVSVFERMEEVYKQFVTEELELQENANLSTVASALALDSFHGDVSEGF
jgi:hypothetical protein